MLDDYSCTFKSWVSPSHALYQEFEGEDFVVKISGSQFSPILMTKLTARQLSMDWIMQAISYRAGGKPKIEENLGQVDSKNAPRDQPKWQSNHEHNPKHDAMFRKNYTAVVERLLQINPFLEDSFIKIGSSISYSAKLYAFIDSILEVHKRNCKEFVDRWFFRCQKMFLI